MNYWNYWKIHEATNCIYEGSLLLISAGCKTAFSISFPQNAFQYRNVALLQKIISNKILGRIA